MMIEQAALPHMIATDQQRTGGPVPDREGKIAKRVPGKAVSPVTIGSEHDHAVRHVAQCGGIDADLGRQRVAIVDPRIGHHHQLAVQNRLRLEPDPSWFTRNRQWPSATGPSSAVRRPSGP